MKRILPFIMAGVACLAAILIPLGYKNTSENSADYAIEGALLDASSETIDAISETAESYEESSSSPVSEPLKVGENIESSQASFQAPSSSSKPSVSSAPASKPQTTSTPTPSAPVSSQSTSSKPSGNVSSQPVTSKPESAQQVQDFAEQVVALVNEERAKAGLKSLSISQPAKAAAQVRAAEIVQSFSHTRPDGRSFATALREQGATYRTAGENIAWGQTSPAQVMQSWMNSAGHKSNILNPDYTAIGVGCYKDTSGRLYWTQIFIGS